MRISDDERQRVVDELAQHLAAGRIDFDAYAERVEEVFGAETLADIDHARRDLPFMRIPLPAGATDGRHSPALRAGRAWGSRIGLLAMALVILLAVVVAVTAQVAWVALLVGGWVLGVVQGRAARHRR